MRLTEAYYSPLMWVMKKLMVALFLTGALSATAVVTINVQQLGADVLVSANGTLDTSGLTFDRDRDGPAWNAYPQSGAFKAGAGRMRYYTGYTSAGGGFGTGDWGFFTADISSGDAIYVDNYYFGVPIGYVSGTSLTGSNTFSGKTISDLEMTPGTYTWTLPNDTITLNISASPVPEPSTYALIAGIAMLGMVLWRRRFVSASVVEL